VKIYQPPMTENKRRLCTSVAAQVVRGGPRGPSQLLALQLTRLRPSLAIRTGLFLSRGIVRKRTQKHGIDRPCGLMKLAQANLGAV